MATRDREPAETPEPSATSEPTATEPTATGERREGPQAGWRRWQPWVSTALRLILAGIWLYAGASKVTDLAGSVDAVFAFRLLPDELARFVGATQPFVEIALGVLFLLGYATRFAAVASAVVMAAFIVAIVSAAARGLRIDCGCFGGGGDLAAGESTRYLADIARDGGILLASAALACWPTTLVALDTRVAPDRPETAPENS